MYRVIISEQALVDIALICYYIEIKLENPISSYEFYEDVRAKILTLSEFPKRFSKTIINGESYHRMSVKSFNVYYCVDINSQTVTIARVLYSGMDINQVAIIN